MPGTGFLGLPRVLGFASSPASDSFGMLGTFAPSPRTCELSACLLSAAALFCFLSRPGCLARDTATGGASVLGTDFLGLSCFRGFASSPASGSFGVLGTVTPLPNACELLACWLSGVVGTPAPASTLDPSAILGTALSFPAVLLLRYLPRAPAPAAAAAASFAATLLSLLANALTASSRSRSFPCVLHSILHMSGSPMRTFHVWTSTGMPTASVHRYSVCATAAAYLRRRSSRVVVAVVHAISPWCHQHRLPIQWMRPNFLRKGMHPLTAAAWGMAASTAGIT